MRNFMILSALGLTLAACGATSPCDEFVEVLCDCAESDEECDEYKKTYAKPTADDDEYCSAGLDDAKDNAETCDTGASST